jgi:hypothetical protein
MKKNVVAQEIWTTALDMTGKGAAQMSMLVF